MSRLAPTGPQGSLFTVTENTGGSEGAGTHTWGTRAGAHEHMDDGSQFYTEEHPPIQTPDPNKLFTGTMTS